MHVAVDTRHHRREPQRGGSPRCRAVPWAGFTLLEMIVVTLLILIMAGMVSLTFANARPSVKLRRDAAQSLAFLRNTWDFVKASSSQLVLAPDWKEGVLEYFDPRTQTRQACRFRSKAHILAIILNDRVYNAQSMPQSEEVPEEGEPSGTEDGSLYIEEGRGLTELAIVFGIPDDDAEDVTAYKWITLAKLNLITGRGQIQELTTEDYDALAGQAETEEE